MHSCLDFDLILWLTDTKLASRKNEKEKEGKKKRKERKIAALEDTKILRWIEQDANGLWSDCKMSEKVKIIKLFFSLYVELFCLMSFAVI